MASAAGYGFRPGGFTGVVGRICAGNFLMRHLQAVDPSSVTRLGNNKGCANMDGIILDPDFRAGHAAKPT